VAREEGKGSGKGREDKGERHGKKIKGAAKEEGKGSSKGRR
jgi:hypothetical protein